MKLELRPNGRGVQYRVFAGIDPDGHKATADRIIGGWAPTREKARKQAQKDVREML